MNLSSDARLTATAVQNSVEGQALVSAIVNMREAEAVAMARDLLGEGMPAQRVWDLSRAAIEEISARFERGEYFCLELILAAEMIDQIASLVKPVLARSATSIEDFGKPDVLIGTVQGDLHDIGKNVVVSMLDINGFQVVDLGIDVPVDTFVRKVREHQPKVIALSGFLTLAFHAMRETVQALTKEGLRDGRKIMIGGGQVDNEIRAFTGADAFGLNAMSAVTLCQHWLR